MAHESLTPTIAKLRIVEERLGVDEDRDHDMIWGICSILEGCIKDLEVIENSD